MCTNTDINCWAASDGRQRTVNLLLLDWQSLLPLVNRSLHISQPLWFLVSLYWEQTGGRTCLSDRHAMMGHTHQKLAENICFCSSPEWQRPLLCLKNELNCLIYAVSLAKSKLIFTQSKTGKAKCLPDSKLLTRLERPMEVPDIRGTGTIQIWHRKSTGSRTVL